MLTAAFFVLAARALRASGRVTVVTDNQAYGESLCGVVARANAEAARAARGGRRSLRLLLSPAPSTSTTNGSSGGGGGGSMVQCRVPLELGLGAAEAQALAAAAAAAKPRRCSAADIVLVRGEAGAAAGHVAGPGASSYFDRMWTKGQKTRRWFLLLACVDVEV